MRFGGHDADVIPVLQDRRRGASISIPEFGLAVLMLLSTMCASEWTRDSGRESLQVWGPRESPEEGSRGSGGVVWENILEECALVRGRNLEERGLDLGVQSGKFRGILGACLDGQCVREDGE